DYELLTDLSPQEISSLRKSAENGERNPRDVKVELAKSIITDFHSQEDAKRAEEEFNRIFRRKEAPEDVTEVSLESGLWKLPRLLVDSGLAPSMAEARRLIEQGGVSIDGERHSLHDSELGLSPERALLIQVGKRKFLRVRGT
ncbi:MAG TPA: tyrosine--tRNA ligase, partial [Blastocatellia bacterium]|nr:tyrosine--tRNA ligase [Blastocatellia bacterium]